MLRASLLTLLAHKARLAMTALAIALVVAFISGTFTFTATLQHDLDSLFRSADAGTDVIVRHQAPAGQGGGSSGARATVQADLLATVAAVPGITAADGVITDQAQLTTRDGNLAGSGPGIATTWRPDAVLDAAFPVHAGRPPQSPDEVAIDQSTATSDGYRVGDTVRIVVAGQARAFHVVGIVGFAGGNGTGRALSIYTTSAAQQLFDKAGRFDEIDVKATAAVTAGQARDRIAAALPAGTEAVTGSDAAAEQSTSVRSDLAFLTNALLAFAAVALFVGAFVIWNTFSILVAGRTRELALLRALGAGRRQVFTAVLTEAAILGLAASGIGVGLGVLAARGLTALLSTFGLDLPSAGPQLPATGIAIAVGAGLGVTILAALAPARRATGVAPVAALRESAPAPQVFTVRRLIAGLSVAAVGGATLAVGLAADTGAKTALTGAGAAAVVLGVTVLAPLAARPMVRMIGAPLRRLPGNVGALAADNAAHNPRRTAATAAALMIGLAAVTLTSVVIGSVKAAGQADIGRASHADLYVVAANTDSVLGPALAPAVAAQPGVAVISETRRTDAVVAGTAHQAVYGIDPATIGQLTDLNVRTGSIDSLTAGDILVSTKAAAAHHWHTGDTVDVRFGQAGEHTLTIGGTFADKGPLGDYLLSLNAFDTATGRSLDYLILIKTLPGTQLSTLRTAVTGLLADYPGAQALDKAGFQNAVGAMFDQLLNLTTGLLVLAVVIALLGIVNTLALSISERTRELGILRAIGIHRRQLAAAITIEALIIGLYGGLLGLLLGAGLGTATAAALGTGTPTLPTAQLGVYLLVAVLATAAAAAAPARRAGRMNMLTAIATH